MPSYGAAPHNDHNPNFSCDQISQSEAQQLARKLTRKDETIQHLSERNQELNSEVERLREVMELVLGGLGGIAYQTDEDATRADAKHCIRIIEDAANSGGDADA